MLGTVYSPVVILSKKEHEKVICVGSNKLDFNKKYLEKQKEIKEKMKKMSFEEV